MIVTYNWLREFVDFDLSPEEVAHLLTMLGLEVEGMTRVGEGLDEVVVAEVLEKNQHPNADKLSLCRVSDGTETFSIVCGARNFSAGDRVALAKIGATLPGDFRIKRSKIRGEESFGMLCSEKELGLAEDSEGIIILPPESSLGVPVFKELGIKDTVFEIGLTPNRADCLSVIGVARELAAKLGKRIHLPGHAPVEECEPKGTVKVEDADLCPRYMARYIEGCTIAPSPDWLVKRLQAVGMRSINNVVDVTNYVLMEYGHPLHAFDFDRLAGGAIVVRRGGEGEKFTTLDGQERSLTAADLTIRDAEKAVAIGGVMGGENSEIGDSTRNILLESAYFAPTAIRRTSKRLGLHTESSHRFERGADIDILPVALNRAASLIAEVSGGKVARGVIDVYPRPVAKRQVSLRVDAVNAILGLKLGAEQVKDLLSRLEFVVEESETGIFQVGVPSFRVDVEREIDLVEEVARLLGYEEIPTTMPVAEVLSDRPALPQRIEKLVKDTLVAEGFNEVVNFSFFSAELLDRLLLDEGDARRRFIPLLNPLSDDQGVMRTTLLPGLLETAARNISHRSSDLRIFELRRVYLPVEGAELPDEPLMVAGLLTGRREQGGWNRGDAAVDFFDLKGVLESVFERTRAGSFECVAGDVDPFYHPGKSCSVHAAGKRVGSAGEIHPDVLERFAISQSVYYFEICFDSLVSLHCEKIAVIPPSKYPDVTRDAALLVSTGLAAGTIVSTFRSLSPKELEGVEVFDVYQGEGIADGMKSVAIRARYRSPDRTLTDEEVTAMHGKILAGMAKKLDITVR